MKPFARIADAHGEDRARAAKADQKLQLRWVLKNGKLECRYVMVRDN